MREDSSVLEVMMDEDYKAPLSREELRDVIDLALWAGQLLLQHGAETARVEETVHRIGTGLGCNWMDILVSPNAVVVTTISGEEFRTKVRRVVSMGVNMTILAEVSDLSYRLSSGELDRFKLRAELERISHLPPNYNRWLVALMVGVACAAFSRLFGGDWIVFGVTLVASSVAMVVRQELNTRAYNPLLVTTCTAFIAGVIASSGTALKLTYEPRIAIAASVLLLVPGVPLLNSAEDLIKGHMVTGIVRGIIGMLISLAISLGLSLAIWLTGVKGF